MTYNEAQYLLFLERAGFWQTLINSGAYKHRKVQRATEEKSADGCFIWRDLTDAELLDDAIATVKRHLEIASGFAEHLPQSKEQLP